MTKKFILWDDSNDPVDISCDLYTWTGYSENENIKSLLKYVDSNGAHFRKVYVRWSYDLGQSKIKGKSLVDYFALDKTMSFWWLTSFVEKSPWKSPSIIDAIRLIALEDLIKKSSYDSFELVSSNKNLNKILSALCLKLNILYKWTKVKEKPKSFFSFRYLFHRLPYFLKGIITLFFYIQKNWTFKNNKRNKWLNSKKSIFICSQFTHLDNKASNAGKFYSRLWENLPELIDSKGYNANFMHLYLKSNEANNPLQANSLIKKFNASKDRDDFHCFLFSYLSLGVAFRVLRLSIKFNYKSWQASSIQKSFKPSNSDLNFWPIMQDNWYSDLCGSNAVINLLWLQLFDKALKEIPHQQCGLFLKENQSWERALIHAWNKNKHGRLIGVAHSTVRFWDLRYFEDNRSMMSSKRYSLPTSDLTVLNGKLAIQAYKDFGSLDETFVECEAIRYNYLDKLNRFQPRPHIENGPKKVLILGDYAPKTTVKLLRLLEVASLNASQEYIYTIKPHPNFIVKLSDYPLLKLDISMKPLVEIMDKFDIAYSGSLTSAALDAYLSGMPTIIALDDEALNFSPLRKQKSVLFVSNPKELQVALFKSISNKIIQPKPKDFFCLNYDLPKWGELLSL